MQFTGMSKLHTTTKQITGMSSLLQCFYSYKTKHSMLLTKHTADINNNQASYTTDTLPRPQTEEERIWHKSCGTKVCTCKSKGQHHWAIWGQSKLAPSMPNWLVS